MNVRIETIKQIVIGLGIQESFWLRTALFERMNALATMRGGQDAEYAFLVELHSELSGF